MKIIIIKNLIKNKQNEQLKELVPEFLKFVKELVWRYLNSPWIYGEGQELIDRVNGKNSVLICFECKGFWLSPIEQCSCGCRTLLATHQSNKKYLVEAYSILLM